MFNVERTGSEIRKLTYNDTKCLGCGICSEVCPTTSLRLGPTVPIARGLIEMDPISVNEDSCVFATCAIFFTVMWAPIFILSFVIGACIIVYKFFKGEL